MSGNDEVDQSNQLNQNSVDVIVHSTPLAASTSPLKNGHDEKLSVQIENSRNLNGDAKNVKNSDQSAKNPFRNISENAISQPAQPQQQQSSAEKSSWVQFENDDEALSKKVISRFFFLFLHF